MKLVCKLHHEWGQSVNVGGTTYTIDKNTGDVDVADEHGAAMLQNPAKWDDAKTAKRLEPGKKGYVSFKEANPGVPNVEIRDPKTGRILNDDEALKALSPDEGTREGVVSGKRQYESPDPIAAQAAALRGQASPTNVVDAKAVEAVVREKPSAEYPTRAAWPQVSDETPKLELVAVLDRLVAAGLPVDNKNMGKKGKKAILDQIEKGYKALAKG